MSADLAEYQERIPTAELRAGDFLYVIEPTKLRGPRGGRYSFAGVRVESRVTEVGYGIGRGRPSAAFGVRTRAGGFAMPGNAELLTTAIIRRREIETTTETKEDAR